uniref:Uncharacterized protein n=1 Tax=Anguilla anguilla TaxID=7936 RepID=A0A0E9VHE1_ANGAN
MIRKFIGLHWTFWNLLYCLHSFKE